MDFTKGDVLDREPVPASTKTTSTKIPRQYPVHTRAGSAQNRPGGKVTNTTEIRGDAVGGKQAIPVPVQSKSISILLTHRPWALAITLIIPYYVRFISRALGNEAIDCSTGIL